MIGGYGVPMASLLLVFKFDVVPVFEQGKDGGGDFVVVANLIVISLDDSYWIVGGVGYTTCLHYFNFTCEVRTVTTFRLLTVPAGFKALTWLSFTYCQVKFDTIDAEKPPS